MEEKKKAYNGEMLVYCVQKHEMQKIRLEKEWYVVGRKSEDRNQGEVIEIPSELMNQIGFSIRKEDNGYVLEAAGKLNHIYYNGSALSEGDQEVKVSLPLHNQDVIGMRGEERVTFIFYCHYKENTKWRTLSLTGKNRLYISRHEVMDEGSEEVREELAELPKRHAMLVLEDNNWYVQDYNTKFGVYVNHQKVEEKQQLYPMDVISIGNTLFLYQPEGICYNHEESDKNRLVIHIEERSVWNLFRRQILLENIDLSILPGEMVLILGGSGTGKTTFINAVTGYEKAKGRIMEGDIDIYENYNKMKYDIGFVPQQDLLRLEERVYDILQNAAEMKLPKVTSEEEKKKRIEEVLELFGLEREKASLAGKLSGGQRKRLSIAMEFIADPSLFFLDEPDSGLDGVMARSLMEDLRGISDQQKMVLVITHSPDRAADLFDKVIVLAKGSKDNVGRMAFYGTIEEAHRFFETDSLEQIIRKLNREDEGGEGFADMYIEKYRQVEEKEHE
ncbi:ABC-type multidrug transport system ATPase subunit [Aequitasia blattaphilus]|uniref:ATP-binding cassette domain-containing protein n=1 Tax=Aequitasia blattaphilus TaxID=2949332 RepID=A0ABT1EES2_9FIRM|nr:ATP-binding cassette domain-containing protein [Aequitasia blattaphilus]MCP1102967.1 ATP-binding cassette domain-containing protein [Aequitasia blattaphilus]MCR8615607.1 ATP-binding cassette domain-containing protein [Aequitasia blattaphilus]